MTCMYKEYDVKTKMVQEQWLKLKMKFLYKWRLTHDPLPPPPSSLTFTEEKDIPS